MNLTNGQAWRSEVTEQTPTKAPEVRGTVEHSDDEDDEEDPNDFL